MAAALATPSFQRRLARPVKGPGLVTRCSALDSSSSADPALAKRRTVWMPGFSSRAAAVRDRPRARQPWTAVNLARVRSDSRLSRDGEAGSAGGAGAWLRLAAPGPGQCRAGSGGGRPRSSPPPRTGSSTQIGQFGAWHGALRVRDDGEGMAAPGHRDLGWRGRGSRSRKRAPLPAGSAHVRVPAWAVAMPRAMAKPSPLPSGSLE